MPAFTARLADGWRRALDDLPLALVPVVFTLLNVDGIRSVATFDGIHVGLKLGAPLSVVTVWQFVSVPRTGVEVDPGVPLGTLPLLPVTVPAVLAARAVLAAGYFGSIRNALAGDSYDFSGNARRHFRPFLILTAVPVLLLLPAALGFVGLGAATGGGGLSGAVLILALVPVYVAVVYLFAATPYLVVLRDVGLVEAARASYGLAVEGGPYVRYFAGFAGFVLAVSPLATAVVVNVPVVGLLVGGAAGAVVGLASNVATMRFVADIDPASETTLVRD